MKFHFPHHHPRSLEDTRQQVSSAVVDLSCQIAQSALSKTIESAKAAKGKGMSTVHLLEIAALSASTRHLGQHIDTIRWTTERLCAHELLAPDSPHHGRMGARSASVVSIIQIFSSFSDVMSPLAGPNRPAHQPT